MLSEHFSLEEFTRSNIAARLGIDNTPPPEVVDNLRRVAAALEVIRMRLGRAITISSGYRCPALNTAAHGAKDSAHMLGLAADIEVTGMTPKQVCTAVAAMGLPTDQIILEFDAWTHVGLSVGVPRGELLTIRTGTGYMKGIV